MHRVYPSMYAAILESALSCKAPQSLDCGAFHRIGHVGKNRGKFGKKCSDTLPAQIQRQTIKVRCISCQKVVHKFLISVVFFLTHSVYSVAQERDIKGVLC